MKKKNIFLILTSENFDLKLKGDKEEIRDYNDYWLRRLCYRAEDGKIDVYQYETVTFQRGYTKEQIIIECLGVYIDVFINYIPDSYKKGDMAFTFELGQIIKS